VTLTYAPEFLPTGGTLVPSHLTGFLKRLRRRLSYRQGPLIRYFGCGEYGDKKDRPHYHVFLFGLGPSWHAEVSASWPHGHVMFAYDPNNLNLMQYTAGYTVKKMEGKNDIEDKKIHPEFARMSLKPAIGEEYIRRFYASVVGHGASVQRIYETLGDAPSVIRLNGQLWPIGRTLRKAAREELGWDISDGQKAVLRDVRLQALLSPGAAELRTKRRQSALAKVKARAITQPKGKLA